MHGMHRGAPEIFVLVFASPLACGGGHGTSASPADGGGSAADASTSLDGGFAM
jgi:hypothetical protein